MKSAFVMLLFLLFALGVFGDTDKVSLSLSVTEGDSVTLHTGVKLQTDDETEWRFNNTRIARVIKNNAMYEDVVGFRERLQLDSQTGDLKVRNFIITDSGHYKYEIISSRESSEKTFSVSVVSADGAKMVSVNDGDSVTLRTGLTEIQRDDEILWRFGQQDSTVAGKTVNVFTSNGPDERFRGRMRQESQTGSLNITNIRTSDSGVYEVDISSTSRRYTIHKSFSVTVSDEVKSVSVLEGDSVTLYTGLTEIQRDDEILWKFGDQDKPIADLNGFAKKGWENIILKSETRDLIIRNIQIDQIGDYKVEIITRRMILHRKYGVTIALSLSAVEWIVVVLLAVAVVAVVAGVVIYCRKISELERGRNSGLSLGAVAGIVVRVVLLAAAVVTVADLATLHHYHSKISEPERQRALSLSAVEWIVVGVLVAVAVVTVADLSVAVHHYCRKISKLERRRDSALSLSAVEWIVVGGVVLLATAGVAGVVIYYRRKLSELERQRGSDQSRSVLINTHTGPDSALSLSAVEWIVVGVLVAVAVVAGVRIYYRRKISKLERQRDPQNHILNGIQDLDDLANEGT